MNNCFPQHSENCRFCCRTKSNINLTMNNLPLGQRLCSRSFVYIVVRRCWQMCETTSGSSVKAHHLKNSLATLFSLHRDAFRQKSTKFSSWFWPQKNSFFHPTSGITSLLLSFLPVLPASQPVRRTFVTRRWHSLKSKLQKGEAERKKKEAKR